ncbi:CD80-like immunoglobulin C2-set, partial [Trinorchestia longiramus]
MLRSPLILLLLVFGVRPQHSPFSFETPDTDISQVEVVEGFNASLPCAIHSPPHDEPVLTLWYFGNNEAPVYSYDQRSGRRPEIWSDVRQIGNRAVYLAHEYPPVLVLFNVSSSDARTYSCRVDYNFSNSKVALTRLTVVVPPRSIHLRVTKATVEEGQNNDVVCSGVGGSPSPEVLWIQEGRVVDSNFSERNGVSYNSLETPASRLDGFSPFTCKVTNNDVTPPLVKLYTRNVTAGPLSVNIVLEIEPLVAGREARLLCEVRGSNPPPRIRWFRNAEQIPIDSSTVRHTRNISTSILVLDIHEQDHGSKLTCRAENPLLPTATLEDIYTLDVTYKPNVSLALGWSLKLQDLKEGNDAFFECRVDANPRPYKVTWLHEGRELEHNVREGVLVSESTLALQRVNREQSGAYRCKASNVEGDALSNPVSISIKYAPRCSVPPSLRGVALFEPTTIRCAVDADPANVTFRWTFNNSARKDSSESVSERKFTTHGLESELSYTPLSERDYGTLLCYAANSVGAQENPCSFTVISAGPPEDISDCVVGNITSHSAGVSCQAGFDGGLPQKFLLQVWDVESGVLVANVTSSRPSFTAYPLEPGFTYRAEALAFNTRGTSDPSRLLFLTLKEAAMHKSLPSMVEPSPFVWVVGVLGGALLVVGVMLMAVWWVRARERRTSGSTKTVTHIVKKENNPDLLRIDNTEESDGDDTSCGVPLKSSTNLIEDTSLELEKVPQETEAITGHAGIMHMGRTAARDSGGRGLNVGTQHRYSSSHDAPMVDYPAG